MVLTTLEQPGDRSVQIVEIPAGTILFKTQMLSDDPVQARRELYKDLLGYPTATGFCLNPVQNVFTFPIPYVGFGLYDWTTDKPAWMKFNTFIAYVLTKPTKMVCQISPSPDVRGTGKGYRLPNSLILRCDKFPQGLDCAKDKKTANALRKANAYDNCINPARKRETGVNGWIAIAEGDSIDQRGKKADKTPMGEYIKSMASYDPVRVRFIIDNLYTDANNHRGIPEIVVHPRLPNDPTIQETVRRSYDGLNIEEEINRLIAEDKLQIVPIGVISSSGINFVGNAETILKPDLEVEETPEIRRNLIELFLDIFLFICLRSGLGELGKAAQDKRTGFFVFGHAGGAEEFIFKKADISGAYKDLAIEIGSAARMEGGASSGGSASPIHKLIQRLAQKGGNSGNRPYASPSQHPQPANISLSTFNTVGASLSKIRLHKP